MKSEILASAFMRMEPAQLDRLALAATDLERAIGEELASDPGQYGALTQIAQDHRHPRSGPAAPQPPGKPSPRPPCPVPPAPDERKPSPIGSHAL